MKDPIDQPQKFRFGVFELDVRAHELRRQGTRIKLQEQPFQILLLLLERSGQVVTRDELRQRIWPSSVFVDFDHGLNNAIARLREVLGDSPTTARFIETIPRVGYRFLGAVAIAGAEVTPASPANIPPEARRSVWRGRKKLAVATGLTTLLMLGALFGLWLAGRDADADVAASVTSPPTSPSIAVLPFVNLSSDVENEHFADGLTDELVSKLAGIRGLKVVARTSSFRFKGKQESAAVIAKALQVSHLLEGSVRRSGAKVRVTAKLVDARKDGHVWAESFERDVGDVFQIQEEIAFAVAAALEVSLLADDELRVRRRGTEDPEAHRLYLIAQAHLLNRARIPDLDVAKRSLDAAIELDPEYAAAHAGLALYHFRRAWSTLADTEEGAQLGMAAAERAIELDPESSEAWRARANFEFWRYRFGGDYASFVAAQSDMRKSIALDPSNSLAFEEFGRALLWHEPDVALTLLNRAIDIDVLCTAPNIMVATLLGNRGQVDAARKQCADYQARYPDAYGPCGMAIATLEVYFGSFEPAIEKMRKAQASIGGSARIQLWAIHMSMGDRSGASQWLDFGKKPFEVALSRAARFAMEGNYEQAFHALEARRRDFPRSHLLDFPTAKFALLAGEPQHAVEILRQRMPDLISGIEPVTAPNLIPALDLVTGQLQIGAHDDAQALLKRVRAYLDEPDQLRLPLITYQRVRALALAGERDAALRALDKAFDEGLRTTWALDLRPQSLLYIDPIEADPALATLRDDPRLARWFGRVKADNARQLAQLGLRQKATVAADVRP